MPGDGVIERGQRSEKACVFRPCLIAFCDSTSCRMAGRSTPTTAAVADDRLASNDQFANMPCGLRAKKKHVDGFDIFAKGRHCRGAAQSSSSMSAAEPASIRPPSLTFVTAKRPWLTAA